MPPDVSKSYSAALGINRSSRIFNGNLWPVLITLLIGGFVLNTSKMLLLFEGFTLVQPFETMKHTQTSKSRNFNLITSVDVQISENNVLSFPEDFLNKSTHSEEERSTINEQTLGGAKTTHGTNYDI